MEPKMEIDSPQLTLQVDLPLPEPTDWRTQVPSVSQLTRRIRGQIENTFMDVWVKGEISNFRKPVSGHAYFLIKDATAQLKAVMFRGALSKVKFQLKDGMEILLHGNLTVYEARGEYQIVADTMEPVGVGALQLAFEQLKAKLAKEGLFDPKKKKPLPYLPKRIAMVTSATGAAVRDVLKVLDRRFPNLEFFVIPANVQGEKAAPDIVTGILRARQWNKEHPEKKIDVLIVGRGGGSLEDLWPFNEEIVARAIFDCDIPVISAVGHEIDFTIADFVADLRAPTPSAAAEIVIPRLEDLTNQVNLQKGRLTLAMKKSLQQIRLHASHLTGRLLDPRQKIRNMRENFRLLSQKLHTAMHTNIRFGRTRWESLTQLLNGLSPLQVIGRGYTITETANGTIVRRTDEVQVGKEIMTRVTNGKIVSQVISLSPDSVLK